MSSLFATYRIHFAVAVVLSPVFLFFPTILRAEEPLIVHEWGTFTALQNEKGDALPGINIDDEPLPDFCHNLHRWALEPARAVPRIMMKGVPERHPYVTLRLETPVLYFHPAKDEKLPFSIHVGVEFHGGWLTEFYPQAEPDAPGLKLDAFNFGPISPTTMGSLTWHNVQVGTAGTGPESDEHIWTAPRNVAASTVTVGPQTAGDARAESEKFLFYRGVGNRPAPLRAEFDPQSRNLTIRSQCDDVVPNNAGPLIDSLWLVDIRRDGAVAWRTLDHIALKQDPAAKIQTMVNFKDGDFSPAHLETLRKAMHAEMVKAGLFDDEATAMLETWRHAYFQSPGLRVFFLVPRFWTDAILPLKLSRPAQIQRVMMGRIELISPEQRDALKKLESLPASNPRWFSQILATPNGRKFYEGRSDFGDLGVNIPADYQTYLDLGRFRNALILAEQKARPDAKLAAFINTYGLLPYEPE